MALTITAGAAAPLVAVPFVAATPTIALAQATVIDAKPFCHDYIYVVKKPGGWQSQIFQTAAENQTLAVMMVALSAFVAKGWRWGQSCFGTWVMFGIGVNTGSFLARLLPPS